MLSQIFFPFCVVINRHFLNEFWNAKGNRVASVSIWIFTTTTKSSARLRVDWERDVFSFFRLLLNKLLKCWLNGLSTICNFLYQRLIEIKYEMCLIIGVSVLVVNVPNKKKTEFSSIAKLLIAFFLLSFCSDVRPAVISGLKELRVLKTTRSSFVDFVDDEYRSLPDMEDRLFR